jgi:hypothetical protein
LENQYFFTRNELKEAKGNTVNETQGITEMKFYFISFFLLNLDSHHKDTIDSTTKKKDNNIKILILNKF